MTDEEAAEKKVLAAAVAADDEGISALDGARACSKRKTPTEKQRGAAARAIRMLTVDGHIEPRVEKGKATRFVITDTGRQQHDWNIRQTTLSRLPEPDPSEVSAEEYARLAHPGGRRAATFVDIDPELRELMTPEERRRWRLYEIRNGEDDWKRWVPSMFPDASEAPFAPHHEHFWDYIWSIELGLRRDPYVAVWNRGGAKSSSVEMAVAALGARGKRKYVLYVSGAQHQANEHVDAIGTLMTGETARLAYPDLASAAVSETTGVKKGWRRNRLWTSSGFVVDAVGLDQLIRGLRIENQRPDMIVLDDIDEESDTPAAVEKKIKSITRKILPLGSQDCIVVAVQNRVHGNSIFARLTSAGAAGEAPRADFLADRIVNGPVPAVHNLKWSQDDEGHYHIDEGEPSWAGMDIESCEYQINQFGITSFLAECQHEDADLDGGMWTLIDFDRIRVDPDDVPEILHACVWVDPAVSKTDKSDSCGVVVDGLGRDRLYYRLWSWEKIASPIEAMTVAILAGMEHGCSVLGVETDQGGDTWEVVYTSALRKLREDDEVRAEAGLDRRIPDEARVPRYEYAKAGSMGMSKVERASRMLAAYEVRRFRHVGSQVQSLERGLKRFPLHKPFDIVDAAYWSWRWLAELGGETSARKRSKARAPRGTAAQMPAPTG